MPSYLVPIMRSYRIALLCGAMFATVAMGQEAKEKPPAKVAELKEAPALPEKNYLDPEGAPLPPGSLARIGSQRFRHGGEVLALAYSPDSKLLATASLARSDSSVRVWEAATGREVLRIPLPIDQSHLTSHYPAVGLGFSPDGKRLFIVAPRNIRTWDVVNKVELSKFDIPENPNRVNKVGWLNSAAITLDGEAAVMAWDGGNLEVRSLANGKVLREIPNPVNNFMVFQTVFSPDGSRFLLDNGRIFDLATLDEKKSILTGFARVDYGLRFVDGGRSVGMLKNDQGRFPPDASFVVVEIESGKIIRSGKVDFTSGSFEVARNGRSIFVGNFQRDFVQILDAETLKETGRLPAIPGVNRMVVSPDGRFLAGTKHYSGAISVWDLSTKQFLASSADPLGFYDARFSSDSKGLLLSRHSSHPTIDWRNGRILRLLPTAEAQRQLAPVAFSPDGRTRVSICLDIKDRKSYGTLDVIDAESGKLLRKLEGHTDFVLHIAFSADGRRVAAGGQDKSIFVWDLATGNRVAHLRPSYLSGFEDLALSGDGKKLCTSNNQTPMGGNVIAAWDVDSGRELLKIESPTRFYSYLALSPDGRLIAGGGGQPMNDEERGNNHSAVTIWDANSGKVRHALPDHELSGGRPGAWCDFSPDGRLLATGDGRGQLRLWEAATGKQVHEFVGHKAMVMTHFSPDGKLLVAASEDAPCYIWEVIPTKAAKLDPEAAWKDLIDDDAKKAFQAIRSLAANPEAAVAMLGAKLQESKHDQKQIDHWLADLESPRFATREEASKELSTIAETIEPQLRKSNESASIEAKSRLDKILESIAKPSPERLRQIRAVQALTYIGTPEALKILERMK